MSLKKLAELSGVSLRYLENLQNGRFNDLPSAPYLYAYIKKIGDILGFDPDVWWDHFEKRGLAKSSGVGDYLPKNRFEREPVQRYAWLVLGVLAIVLYFAIRLPKIFGTPPLTISYPAEETVTVRDNNVLLSGSVEDARQIIINSESISIGEDGVWEKQILLQPGLNTFEITAKKFLGRENRQVRQIFYEPAQPDNASNVSSAFTATSTVSD